MTEKQLDITSKFVLAAVSLIVFIKGFLEYQKASRWKKLEFVSKEVKEFFNDSDVELALSILDCNAKGYNISLNGKNIQAEENDVIAALKSHDQKIVLTEKQIKIKRAFDMLLERLTLFENYIETGLLTACNLKPYLNYYIQILNDTDKCRINDKIMEQLDKYILEYGYNKITILRNRKEFIKPIELNKWLPVFLFKFKNVC